MITSKIINNSSRFESTKKLDADQKAIQEIEYVGQLKNTKEV